jgi:hypothetical protein
MCGGFHSIVRGRIGGTLLFARDEERPYVFTNEG